MFIVPGIQDTGRHFQAGYPLEILSHGIQNDFPHAIILQIFPVVFKTETEIQFGYSRTSRCSINSDAEL